MLLIVIYHAYCHGREVAVEEIYSMGKSLSTVHHLVFYILGNCGVTGFIFISGWYGLRFKWGKFRNLVLTCAFYFLATALLVKSGGGGTILRMTLHPWDAWWFINCYILLYLLSPVIESGIGELGKSQFSGIVISLLVYEYWGHFLGYNNDHDFILLLTIYLTARYLKIYPPPYKNSGLLGTALLSLSALIAIPIVLSLHNLDKYISVFISYNNVLILLFAGSLIMLLSEYEFHSRAVNYVSSSVLAVYLITESSLRDVLNPWMENKILGGLGGYVYVVAVFAGCILTDKLRMLLFDCVGRVYNFSLRKLHC